VVRIGEVGKKYIESLRWEFHGLCKIGINAAREIEKRVKTRVVKGGESLRGTFHHFNLLILQEIDTNLHLGERLGGVLSFYIPFKYFPCFSIEKL